MLKGPKMRSANKLDKDLLDLLDPSNKPRDSFRDRPLAKISEYYVSGDIESPEEYTEWFDHIRNLSQNDVLKIHINSYGGDLFTAIQFMRVLQESEAQIVTSVEGACMSAATMIFLQGHQFEVSSHSVFMFHNYSGGTIGKGGEMIDQLLHERSWSEKLLKEVYVDFLTDKEIESILNNKDIWMDGDEVIGRLKKKAKKVNAKKSKNDDLVGG